VCTPPSVPTIETATPGNGQVTLSWTASTGGAVSYAVSRGTVGGGAYSGIANPTGTTYADLTASNGTTYYYVVSASNGTCSSANSTEVSATPIATCAQAAPSGVTATAGNRQVTLSWTAAAQAAAPATPPQGP
jgi:cellulose 1,4-beta-cellobiosidase